MDFEQLLERADAKAQAILGALDSGKIKIGRRDHTLAARYFARAWQHLLDRVGREFALPVLAAALLRFRYTASEEALAVAIAEEYGSMRGLAVTN